MRGWKEAVEIGHRGLRGRTRGTKHGEARNGEARGSTEKHGVGWRGMERDGEGWRGMERDGEGANGWALVMAGLVHIRILPPSCPPPLRLSFRKLSCLLFCVCSFSNMSSLSVYGCSSTVLLLLFISVLCCSIIPKISDSFDGMDDTSADLLNTFFQSTGTMVRM